MNELISLSEASKRADERADLIGFFVKSYHIPTFKHPLSGAAKCLDRAGQEQLAHLVADFRDLNAAQRAELVSKLTGQAQKAKATA